jgi:hypothetical protein
VEVMMYCSICHKIECDCIQKSLEAVTVVRKYNPMKRRIIPEWDGFTDYRSPVFEEYKFRLVGDPKDEGTIRFAALEYADEIVGDPSNDKWVERRKLTDAFNMGIEYAKRHLNCH